MQNGQSTILKKSKQNLYSYYEYKYLVRHRYLNQITDLLDEFLGHSDPFPSGIVDSIYYDNYSEDLYFQCLNGDSDKLKFRIRGYGNNQYGSLQQKLKRLSGVGKYKSKIESISSSDNSAPFFEELKPYQENFDFSFIQYSTRPYGVLLPSIRIKYHRHRYRHFDYRITLDTNIEAYAPNNGIPRKISYGILPYHVLEIKTQNARPLLPFIGLVKLQQVSFSKFMLGINLLNSLEF